MTYLVHINPTPGKDDRVVEVEGDGFRILENGAIGFSKLIEDDQEIGVAAFSKGVWNYVEPKK